MELENMDKLEEKVRALVNGLKKAKEENQKLKDQVELLQKESSGYGQERVRIKEKVETLIQLIDSIDK